MAQSHVKTDFAELQAIAVFHPTHFSGSTRFLRGIKKP
jgi:hypothetical protein